MSSTGVLTTLNRKLKCQLFNIRAFSIAGVNYETSSEQKQHSTKSPLRQPRKLGGWIAVAFTAGAISYYFWNRRRTRDRQRTAASKIRADLPSFSAKDAHDRRYYIYGVGVYDLKDYAKNEHPGGEKTITSAVGGNLEKIWSSEKMKFHEKKEILELLEEMRVGNVEGSLNKSQQRCKSPKVGEGPLCLVPDVNAQEYRLELKIDDGNSLKSLTLEELRRYPKHSIISSIPCKNDPTKKETGSTWTGVQLRDILNESKINKADYDQIRFECLDSSSTADKPYGSTVPIDRVLSDPNFEVLLAYEKDGSDISPQHGYPVRVVMPQAAGAKNVKWLHRVVLVKKPN